VLEYSVAVAVAGVKTATLVATAELIMLVFLAELLALVEQVILLESQVQVAQVVGLAQQVLALEVVDFQVVAQVEDQIQELVQLADLVFMQEAGQVVVLMLHAQVE
jgi:hypothetical protein